MTLPNQCWRGACCTPKWPPTSVYSMAPAPASPLAPRSQIFVSSLFLRVFLRLSAPPRPGHSLTLRCCRPSPAPLLLPLAAVRSPRPLRAACPMERSPACSPTVSLSSLRFLRVFASLREKRPPRPATPSGHVHYSATPVAARRSILRLSVVNSPYRPPAANTFPERPSPITE